MYLLMNSAMHTSINSEFKFSEMRAVFLPLTLNVNSLFHVTLDLCHSYDLFTDF